MIVCRLLVLALAVVAAAPNQKPSSAADAIAKVRAEWAKDLHDKQPDQFVSLYTADAVFLTPNGQRITGRAAIRTLTKQAMDTFTSDLHFQSMVTESSGDLAYDSGVFHETLTVLSDGSKKEGEGNYLMVFKRQTNGSWLITQQVWTQSTAAHP